MKTTKTERKSIEYEADNNRLVDADLISRMSQDIDTLESRLKLAEEMLERAKVELDRVVAYAPATEAEEKLASEFLSDLAKGFPGGEKE